MKQKAEPTDLTNWFDQLGARLDASKSAFMLPVDILHGTSPGIWW